MKKLFLSVAAAALVALSAGTASAHSPARPAPQPTKPTTGRPYFIPAPQYKGYWLLVGDKYVFVSSKYGYPVR